MRPSRSLMLLQFAALVATRSTCNRLPVGAVIARRGRVIMTGYNGPPSRMKHCNHPLEELGADYSCRRAVHAERNAIDFAAREGGIATEGAELYLTHSPCFECAKDIIQAGIVAVYYGIEFRSLDGLDLLEEAEVETYYEPT